MASVVLGDGSNPLPIFIHSDCFQELHSRITLIYLEFSIGVYFRKPESVFIPKRRPLKVYFGSCHKVVMEWNAFSRTSLVPCISLGLRFTNRTYLILGASL